MWSGAIIELSSSNNNNNNNNKQCLFFVCIFCLFISWFACLVGYLVGLAWFRCFGFFFFFRGVYSAMLCFILGRGVFVLFCFVSYVFCGFVVLFFSLDLFV